MNQTDCALKLRSALENADHPLAPRPGDFQPTSVMALILPSQTPKLLFIQKADVEGYPWRNQMAFPGGHRDPTDPSALGTALREVEEELDIRPENVEVIGSLGHYQTIHNKDIQAFTGIWNKKDRINFDRSEISRVFKIPMAYLMDLHREKNFHESTPGIDELTYPFEDVVIWGVTAKILFHLIEIITRGD